MNEFDLLVDLHKGARRQGPGDVAATEQAMCIAGLSGGTPLNIADIGCGTGASTMILARLLNAKITAVDFFQDFLDVLVERAQGEGVAEKITPLCASMEQLPFDREEFDVIWSEGAIYNIGFAKGVVDWKRYLKPGGLLVASEITWLTEDRPAELQDHWNNEYPEIDTASAKIRILEESGYTPIGYFILPEGCWLENYYEPMRKNLGAFLSRNGDSAEARTIVEAAYHEIEIYEQYNAYFSYGVYIVRKPNA